MKAWGEDDPQPRPSGSRRANPTPGAEYTRTDQRVLLLSMALDGHPTLEVVVLVDPRTGDRYGEVSAWQGIHPISLAGLRLLRSSPEAVAALEQLATSVRDVRRASRDRHAARHARWMAREARSVAAEWARPVEGELAFDAGDAVAGNDPEAATWCRTGQGTSLHVPERWAGEWQGSRSWSTNEPSLLVAANPESGRALTALARQARARTSASGERAERVARRIGERCLRDLAPQFENQWLPEASDRR